MSRLSLRRSGRHADTLGQPPALAAAPAPVLPQDDTAGPSWPPTVPMAAITASVTWPATGLRTTPEPLPQSGPCPCGMHPEPAEPAAGPALLSCYPGVTEHMWEARVANGQWDDIPALWDDAWVAVHQPARKCRRNIHREVRASSRRMSVAFDRHPGWRTDEGLAGQLARAAASYETELAMQQTYLHDETLRRIAALRDDLTGHGTEEAAA